MGPLIVFDADVLIAYLGNADANHTAAVDRMRIAVSAPSRSLCAVNYTELMVGPLRRSAAHAADVDLMLEQHAIEVVPADHALARRAAEVRARSALKLPDAYAVATALSARSGGDDVRLESFDRDVLRTYERLAAEL